MAQMTKTDKLERTTSSTCPVSFSSSTCGAPSAVGVIETGQAQAAGIPSISA